MASVYTVSQVNSYISGMFREDFLLRNLCIKGEVSNLKYHSSGHVYFTLKDEKGAISAIMFRNCRPLGLKFNMQDGDLVRVTGSINNYEKTGHYQIYANSIELDGLGDLYVRYEALKKELSERGMFSDEYKRPIPKYASRIGIVTAPTGAAVQDIIHVSKRRNPGVTLILYPAQVQGEGAVESIVSGIRALDDLGVDVIIVGRGGGSIEDLWAFNEIEVAEAIFSCATPVISAVGHETDTTIADYVADLRAPTPSAAAELAVYMADDLMRELEVCQNRMLRIIQSKMQYTKERLNGYCTSFNFLSPRTRVNVMRQEAVDYYDAITSCMQKILTRDRNRLLIYARTLDGISPMKRMAAGYAYLQDMDGRQIRSITSLKASDHIRVSLSDGCLEAEVLSLEEENYGYIEDGRTYD